MKPYRARWLARLAGALLLLASPLRIHADDNAPAFDAKTPEWMNDPTAHMIAIEALVVEVNENKTRDLGLHYGYASNDVSKVVEGGDFLFGRPLDPVKVSTFKGDGHSGETSTSFESRLPGLGINLHQMDVNGGVLSARLRALLDSGDAKITTRPILLALDGTQSQLMVGRKIPYQDVAPVYSFSSYSTMYSNAGQAALATLQIAEGEVGVKMDVTPKIIDLARQIVELNITNVEISNLSQIITTQNIDRPVFNRANTMTKVTMRAGETFQLSSLKGRRKRVYREGVPILMHIPLLGWLFSSREEVEENVDILFFVTPHIVKPGETAMVPFDFKHSKDLVQEGLRLPEEAP